MKRQGENQSAQNGVTANRFCCGYAIFQILLATFANAFFLWVCLAMHRKAVPQSTVHLLAIVSPLLAVLAMLAPLLWLWSWKRGSQASSMTPRTFMWGTGRSLHISEAFVVLGLILFFSGAPATTSALVPALALCFDALLLLPWAIKYKMSWWERRDPEVT